MIITVTLNPSLDRAIEVDSLVRGGVIRAAQAHLDPGGKGVNVSRALLANGVATCAVLPWGGDEGAQVVTLLQAEGVRVRAVPIVGHTRSNITLAEPDGTVTKINEPGPTLSATELETLTGEVRSVGVGASWVVVSGSMPPDLQATAFSALCRDLLQLGAGLAVDTSGPALMAAVAAGATLVKPNREELAEAVGVPLRSLGDVVNAAHRLRESGAGAVLASLGADGAVLVDGHGVISGESSVTRPRSSVGAGDALLAGFLAAGATGPEALAQGLAWGAAAVQLPGSRMPGAADLRLQDVRLHASPDEARPLLPTG